MPSGVYQKSPETRAKLSALKKGKKRAPFSDEWKKNMSLSRIGKKQTEEHKNKTRERVSGENNPMYGKTGDANPARRADVREKISLSKQGKPRYDIRGANSYRWKGGITPINEQIRKSLEYVMWRRCVFERDKYTCVWCGDNKGGNLHADHIKPFAYYPELRFAIDNGRTLCKSCHMTTDTWGHKAKNHERK